MGLLFLVLLILAIAAIVCTILNAALKKLPLWVAVLLLSIFALLVLIR
jgi:hypothetical protein